MLFRRRPAVLRTSLGLILTLAVFSLPPADAALTIAGEGTANPTLMYQGKPLFAIGPLPEEIVFAVKIGSSEFDHLRWLDWMQRHDLNFGRVYPDSAYLRRADEPGFTMVPRRANERLYPFEVVRWEKNKPIVDLTRFNPAYWENMARVIQAAAERGIVLQMQLYQRVYFHHDKGENGWQTNYFHPANNVNDYPAPIEVDDWQERLRAFWKKLTGDREPAYDGYGVFQAMAEYTVWRQVHRQWVEHILAAIGDSGNVIIDLMNEGAFDKGISYEWIEYTLNIIERWERKTGHDLLVGMDFDHLYKGYVETGDHEPLEYVLSHPRMELIICEGSESHVVPTLVAGDRREPDYEALALEYRERYRKPVISANSPSYGPHDDPEALHLYQWYSLLAKVQAASAYAKDYKADLDRPPLTTYVRRARILRRFFEGFADYAALQPAPPEALTAPGRHTLAMTSSKEAVVYLHAGIGANSVAGGEPLRLAMSARPEGVVTIEAVDPHSGRNSSWQAIVREGTLTTRVPAFDQDLALYIVPARWAAILGPR
jgi:hypothetical protein